MWIKNQHFSLSPVHPSTELLLEEAAVRLETLFTSE